MLRSRERPFLGMRAIYHHDYTDSVRGKVAPTMKTMELDGPFLYTSSRVRISPILKDKIHTTPDTPEIRQVKKTQEAVSELIYKSDFFKMQDITVMSNYLYTDKARKM
ncbi:NEB [Vulpes lagopus]